MTANEVDGETVSHSDVAFDCDILFVESGRSIESLFSRSQPQVEGGPAHRPRPTYITLDGHPYHRFLQ